MSALQHANKEEDTIDHGQTRQPLSRSHQETYANENTTDAEQAVHQDVNDEKGSEHAPTGKEDAHEIAPAGERSAMTTREDVEKEPVVERPSTTPAKQYSVFSTNEKRIIIAAGSLAGFFSPLTGSIYFPALNTIAQALNVSGSKINLTVTTYLILQGAAPMVIAGFSDSVSAPLSERLQH